MSAGRVAAPDATAVPFERKTMLIGIGAPKSGTSWLYAYLRDHARIFMSPLKEMHVWNARFRPEIAGHWDGKFVEKLGAIRSRAGAAPTLAQAKMISALKARIAMAGDLAEYTAFFRRNVSPQHLAFGEVTPGYGLLREDGLQALRGQHPNVKLFFVMRDPVERFWSALRMRQRMDNAYVASEQFEGAFDDANLLERGRYDLTLEALDRVFPPRDVWIGFYETLFTPARIGALCSFVGVNYRQPDFERRPNKAPAVALTSDQRAFARARLDRVYRYCQERFGDRLPDTWMR